MDVLEEMVNAKWGSTQFDWVIGRTQKGDKQLWFWYCGTPDDERRWKHGGYTTTIEGALRAMLEVE
jgi:hypothetical protein